jgi:hypothetical protein
MSLYFFITASSVAKETGFSRFSKRNSNTKAKSRRGNYKNVDIVIVGPTIPSIVTMGVNQFRTALLVYPDFMFEFINSRYQ